MQTVDDSGKKQTFGLGRGLDSLIPIEEALYDDSSKISSDSEIDVRLIEPNPKQPRQNFNEEALAELASSIREHGILQPLLVTRFGDKYQLIAGERRLRAAKIAGLNKVPVIIRSLDEQSKLELALIENVQRENLNPLESALSYKKLIDEFNLTQEEVAKRVGKARTTIANSIRLLSLPFDIKQGLIEGKITEGHARTLLGLENKEEQLQLYNQIISDKLNVREAEAKSSRSNNKGKREKDPDFLAAEKRMSESLSTKVEIKRSKKGGQVVITYHSAEDLEKIFRKIVSS